MVKLQIPDRKGQTDYNFIILKKTNDEDNHSGCR